MYSGSMRMKTFDSNVENSDFLGTESSQHNVHNSRIMKHNPRNSLLDATYTFTSGAAVKKCTWVINPEKSKFIQRWDIIIISALVYVATVTPVQVSMMEAQLDFAFVVNCFVDLIFVSDMILQFFIMYPKPTANGYTLEHKHREIVRHYMHTWFCIDFISILPFDAVSIFTNSEGMEKIKAVKVIRLLRLLKLLRVLKGSRVLRRYELKMQISYQMLALVKFFSVLIAITHWMSNLWALTLMLVEEDSGTPRWVDSLAQYEQDVVPMTKDSPWKLYITCFYFTSYTITSVGYGDIGPHNILERIVCTVMIGLSGVAWAMVIGQVCGIIGNMSSDDKAFRNTMDELNHMMEDRKLPVEMRRRLRSFFLSNKTAQRMARQSNIITAMSEGLQGELSVQMNRIWLVKVTFLREFLRRAEAKGGNRHISGFINDVSKSLKKEVHAQADCFGSPQVLYILNRGLVSNAAKGATVHTVGDVWGLDFVLTDFTLLIPPECFALTYSELMTVRHDYFMEIVEKASVYCPMIKVRVRRFAVRLACQRGIMREARRRIEQKIALLNDPSNDHITKDDDENVAGFSLQKQGSASFASEPDFEAGRDERVDIDDI
jgi:potassium voltage-gated channel Eag-related subfamily H protein 7